MAAVSGHGVVVEEEFSERELEVAAILADLPSIVRAQRRRHRRLEKQQQQRPEIPTWGRRRPRKAPPALPAVQVAEKPAAAAAEDDHTREGATSPDTPLAFPDDHHDVEDKAAAHEEVRSAVPWPIRFRFDFRWSLTCSSASASAHQWAQQQRGVVASLSHENAHLLKQIEEFRARLETSRSTNESLNQMQQSKHKKRHRQPSAEEDEERRPNLQARIVAAVADRPALDLNEPAEADAEDAKPQAVAAQWFHRGHQHQQQLVQQKAALTAAARRRRREIRRAKASGSGASRTRRPG
ncbi:hypothetical protein ACQ4PT_010901 [Festuca glaucescens]